MSGEVFYIFVDTETSGLNFSESGEVCENVLLEFSFILTDASFGELARFSSVVGCDIDVLGRLLSPGVFLMHQRNGLLGEVLACGKSVSELEGEVLGLLGGLVGCDARLVLAGSSVGFDFEVIRRFLPGLFARLDYQVLDVSSVREFFRGAGAGVVTERVLSGKCFEHRALSDIEESLRELRAYCRCLRGRVA